MAGLQPAFRRRLSMEPLEPRLLLAYITRVFAPEWSFGNQGGYPEATNLDWNAPERYSEVSFRGASWDIRYFGQPSRARPDSFQVREGGTAFTIQPSSGESVGDEVKVTLVATIDAASDHSRNPNFGYESFDVFAPHDRKRIDATVVGPNGTLLDFHASGGFGRLHDSGSQTFDARIGDTIPLTFEMSGDGYYFNVTEGTLRIRVTFGGEQDLRSPDEPLHWNTVEEQGGFTFSYDVINTTDEELPSSTIKFHWAQGPTANDIVSSQPAFEFRVGDMSPTGIQIEAGGNDFKTEGLHTIFVPHSSLIAGRRSPPVIDASDPDNIKRATHLVMILDANHEIDEFDEQNNEAQLKVEPLVINVVTHGFRPAFDSDLSKFLAPFQALARTLEAVPEPDSILEGRIATHVPVWDSTTSFDNGFFRLLDAKAAEAEIAILRREGGDQQVIDRLQSHAIQWRDEAIRSQPQSDMLLKAAAHDAFRALTGGEDLLEAAKSNESQKIHLVGHSRGAALNARLARMLYREGYRNVEVTMLDGYDREWPNGGGVLSSIDIENELFPFFPKSIGRNFRAEFGLERDPNIVAYIIKENGQLVLDLIAQMQAMHSGEDSLRAPERDPSILTNAVLPTTAHTHPITILGIPIDWTGKSGITAFYEANPPYHFLNFVGRHRADGINGESGPGPRSPDASPEFVGFVDGSIDDLWTLWSSAQALTPLNTGIALLDNSSAESRELHHVLGVFWNAVGEVDLLFDGGNSELQLTQSQDALSSVAQFVSLPDRTDGVEFDIEADAAGPGDGLSVSFNGQLLQTIDLSQLSGRTRIQIPLTTAAGFAGEFKFELSGPASDPAIVRLDNFAVTEAPNQAPVLADRDLALPELMAGQPSAENLGASVNEWTAGISDGDPLDELGIAIVATNPAVGIVEFSTDAGVTWRPLAGAAESNALLLAADGLSRVRLLPAGNFSGQAADVVQFRAWDRSTGITAVSGERFDASTTGGASPFSAEVDQVSVTVTPNPYPWHNHDFDVDVDADGVATTEDLLAVLNWVLVIGSGPLLGGPGNPPQYIDVVPDGLGTTEDLLSVLSYLLLAARSTEPEGELSLLTPDPVGKAPAPAFAAAIPLPANDRNQDDNRDTPLADLATSRARDFDLPEFRTRAFDELESLLDALAEDQGRH